MPGITTSRIVLGTQLRQYREARSISRGAAASTAGCSVQHIGHVETGRNAPTNETELDTLARLYGIDSESLTYLKRLWVDASKPGWWSSYGLAADYARYVGLETDAEQLSSLELENVPGLLQTERYMRHMYGLERPLPGTPPLSEREIDKRIATRLRRQHRIISGDDPLRFTAVISAGALLRCAFTPGMGQGQLNQLIQRASLPNVELRILRLSAGMHAGQDGAFSLLSFPDRLLPDLVYQETSTGSDQTDAPALVERLHTRFGQLCEQALDPDESVSWLAQLAEGNTQY